MKATKSQIAEVTAEATKQGVNVESALSALANCSASIYKVIGAIGVVESAAKVSNEIQASNDGGVQLTNDMIVKVTEKAYLLNLNQGLTYQEKWVAKSTIKVINGNSIIPFWAIK